MSKDRRVALGLFVAGALLVGQVRVLDSSLWSGVTDGSELSAGMFVLWVLSGLLVWPGLVLMIAAAGVFIASLFAKPKAETNR